jgi:hypothetical protein
MYEPPAGLAVANRSAEWLTPHPTSTNRQLGSIATNTRNTRQQAYRALKVCCARVTSPAGNLAGLPLCQQKSGTRLTGATK